MDSAKLFQLRRELNEFLSEHPNLRPLQKRIDDTLKKAGSNVDNRLLYFKILMQDVMSEYVERLNQLGDDLKKTVTNLKEISDGG